MSTVAVVTGASRGLGLMTARHLRKSGFAVGAIARTTSDSLSSADDNEAMFVAGDVASYDDMVRSAEATRARLGDARILICNAAILGPIGRLDDVTSDEYRRAFDVNVLGVVNTIKAYWSQLASAGDARAFVVTGGGTGGPRPLHRAPAYVPSKAALTSLVEVLAPEFAEIGAAITAIAPGAVIPTDFLSSVGTTEPSQAGTQLSNEADLQRVARPSAADGYLRLLDYLVTAKGHLVNGLTLSGRWNSPEQLDSALGSGLTPGMYRLRRIDGDLFSER